ncbi:MAG: LysR family transcriptional regulator [Pseudomonadota bacterium]|nr:LysR family transcriptional regulator [Rubrivivax sp.]
MLHSRLLRYLDEVARCGSIRAAGDKLHVAPSAINKHLLQLEQAIGEPLFERLPRGLRLTPAGEILIAHARRTMMEFRQVEAEIRERRTLPSGEVVIATMSGLASSIVPKAAAGFSARYPHIRIAIRVLLASEILRALVDGEADLGLGFNLPPSPALESLWEVDTSFGAILAPTHTLAGMESVSLADCASFPLVFADRSMLIHGIVAEGFAGAGIRVEPTFRTGSIEAMKRLAAIGENVAFLSRFDIAEEYHAGVLTFRKIRDAAFRTNTLALVRRAKHGRGLAGTRLAEEVIGVLDAMIA